MAKRKDHGEGAIDERKRGDGSSSWRIRYRVDGKRYTKTFRGTKTDANKELRRLLKSADDGQHVEPSRLKLEKYKEQWIEQLGRGSVNQRTLERYEELLDKHVIPTLGDRPMQRVAVAEIDKLYADLADTLAPRTVHHVHVVLGAMFKHAVRKGVIPASPVARATAPRVGESDVGQALSKDDLQKLLDGFRGLALHDFVEVAARTGARRNEILALRHSDVDLENGTITIARAAEKTHALGLRVKEPKTKRGVRTIKADGTLMAILRKRRELHQRLVAGVANDADVDIKLVRLPDGALVFPAPDLRHVEDLTRLRSPDGVTKGFIAKAKRLGFKKLRLHDLRATHGTLLLNAGIPVHEVARRLGHDPAILLRAYAKWTKAADDKAADAVAEIMG